MKIIELQVENVKKLKAVQIKPDGSLVIVGGQNGAGKTSLLDSIAYALGGKTLCPSKPIREGEEKAKVYVDLGAFTVERVFTTDHSYLTVKNSEGFTAQSPQAILDELVGDLTFDALGFANMSPKDQVATLKDLVGLDFSELDSERQQLYDSRRDIRRKLKDLQGTIKTIPQYDDVPDNPLSVSGLMDQLNALQEENQSNAAQRARLDKLTNDLQPLEDELASQAQCIQDLEQQLQEAQTLYGNMKLSVAKHRSSCDALRETVSNLQDKSTDEIESKLQRSDSINEKIRSNSRREELNDQISSLSSQVNHATERLKAIDEEKAQQLLTSELPIDGLAFDNDGVTFKNIPFKQLSQAEVFRVSVAMGLAMNPKLNIMLIRHGSLLDENNLRIIEEMATDKHAQIWIERVASDDKDVSVLIEDGSIATTEETPF